MLEYLFGDDSKFALILGCSCIIWMPYSVPVAFLPNLGMEIGLDEAQIGYILGSYAVGLFFTSLWAVKNMKNLDKKKTLVLSLSLLVFGLVIFSILVLTENPFVFEIMGVIARLIQGVSVALTSCILYSLIPKYYPDTMQKKIGLLEMVSGVGIGIGPLIGSFAAYFAGYSASFLSVAFVILIFLRLLAKWDMSRDPTEEQIPIRIESKSFGKSLFITKTKSEETLIQSQQRKDRKSSYSFFFRDFRMSFSFLLFTVVATSYSIYTPVLSVFVFEKFEIGPKGTAFLLALLLLFYSLPSFFSDYVLSKKYDRRLYIVGGFLGQSVGLIFMAGSFYIGHHIVLLILGMSLLGFGSFCSNLPTIPEFIDITKEISPQESIDTIDDYSSSLLNCFWGLAEFIGPILGGTRTKHFDFTTAIEIYSLGIWAVLAGYLTLGRGLEGLKISYQRLGEKKEKLLDEGDYETI